MKKLMITGALIGFALGLGAAAVTRGSSWPAVLVRASVAALCGGWLLRWWGTVWVNGLHQTHALRRAANESADADAASTTVKK